MKTFLDNIKLTFRKRKSPPPSVVPGQNRSSNYILPRHLVIVLQQEHTRWLKFYISSAWYGRDFLLLAGGGQGSHLGDTRGPPNIVAFLDRDVRLNCPVLPNATTAPVWRRTMPLGAVVNISNAEEKYKINHNTLIILTVSYNDSGMYTCGVPGSNETKEVHVTVLSE